YLRAVFKALDGVISVSRATKEACVDRGMDVHKGVVLPNGLMPEDVDDTPYDRGTGRGGLSGLPGVPLDGKPGLGTPGGLVKRKGHTGFVEQVLPLIGHNVIYVVLGDGPEMAGLRQAMDTVDPRHQVFLLGRQPDEVLRLAYQAADLFIMPNIVVPGDMEG